MVPRVEIVGDVAIVEVRFTELDFSNVDEFKQVIADVTESHDKIVLDLSRVRFVDSSGCGAILAAYKDLSARGGALALCGVTPPVRTVFELIRLHRVTTIHETRDEAIAALGAS